MKGVSSIISVVLVLLIGVTLVSSIYLFFTGALEESTESGSRVKESITSSLLAELKIEPFTSNDTVSVKNIGKVNVTNINVYVNGELDKIADVEIMPGSVENIVLDNSLSSGDTVEVTSAEGATAITVMS